MKSTMANDKGHERQSNMMSEYATLGKTKEGTVKDKIGNPQTTKCYFKKP